MEYTVQQLARLAGVSGRTLRYYHQIGLLSPSRISPAGYRLYGSEQVDRLQQILFYRAFGLELAAIGNLLDAPEFDRLTVLEQQLTDIRRERERLAGVEQAMERTIASLKGEYRMTDLEKFEGLKEQWIEKNEQAYGEEIRQAYGEEMVERSYHRFRSLTATQIEELTECEKEIARLLILGVNHPQNPEIVASLFAVHRRWLCFYWERYDSNAHRGLAEMYLSDPRFTAYYDAIIPGGTAYLVQAIRTHTT